MGRGVYFHKSKSKANTLSRAASPANGEFRHNLAPSCAISVVVEAGSLTMLRESL
jgi:hypothetical protein